MTEEQVKFIFNQPFKITLEQRSGLFENCLVAFTGWFKEDFISATVTVLRNNFTSVYKIKFDKLKIENGELIYNNN